MMRLRPKLFAMALIAIGYCLFIFTSALLFRTPISINAVVSAIGVWSTAGPMVTVGVTSSGKVGAKMPDDLSMIGRVPEMTSDLVTNHVSSGVIVQDTKAHLVKDHLSTDTIAIKILSTTSRVFNSQNYEFLIEESNFCKTTSSNPLLLTIVHTRPSQFDNRMAIRNTWGNNRNETDDNFGIDMKILFAMGTSPAEPELIKKIRLESDRYHDIIQENFVDAYRNLTLKAVMWLRWVHSHCPNAFYVLKVDDDVLVNRFNILKLIRYFYDTQKATNRSIICDARSHEKVIRDKTSKWYVSEAEHASEIYDTYCPGTAYMMSSDLPSLLYKMSMKTKFFWIDDIYVTGQLPQRLTGVTYYGIKGKHFVNKKITEAASVSEHAYFMNLGQDSHESMYDWWNAILRIHGIMVATTSTTTANPVKKMIRLMDILDPNAEDPFRNAAKENDDIIRRLLSKDPNVSDDNSSLPLCPDPPPYLVGNMTNTDPIMTHTETDIMKRHPEVSGGHWRPSHCRAGQKVAIIIPFRDRHSHLNFLLDYLIPMLQRQLLDFRFIVVEQRGHGLFNKGRLMNAAFLLAQQLGVDCAIFHDVDMYPEDDRNLYYCSVNPRHLGAFVDTLNYTLLYYELMGGSIAMTPDHYRSVNGHSNMYWGWGGEDDDIGFRLMANNYTIDRPPNEFGRYTMIKHEKRPRESPELIQKLLNTAKTRWPNDGLNETSWRIISSKIKPLYHHLRVDVGVAPAEWYQKT